MRKTDVSGGCGDAIARAYGAAQRHGEPAKKPTVILNGVSPRAQAGVKRSEGSLTDTRAEAAGESSLGFSPNTRRLWAKAQATLGQRFFTPPLSQSLQRLRSE